MEKGIEMNSKNAVAAIYDTHEQAEHAIKEPVSYTHLDVYKRQAENVCRQAHRVLDNNKEGAPCASASPQTMEGSF